MRDALAFEWRVQGASGAARANWWLLDRWRRVPQPERRIDFHALPGIASGDAFDRAGCRRAAAHGDSLRRSGDVPGAQTLVSAAVQPLGESWTGFHDSFW